MHSAGESRDIWDQSWRTSNRSTEGKEKYGITGSSRSISLWGCFTQGLRLNILFIKNNFHFSRDRPKCTGYAGRALAGFRPKNKTFKHSTPSPSPHSHLTKKLWSRYFSKKKSTTPFSPKKCSRPKNIFFEKNSFFNVLHHNKSWLPPRTTCLCSFRVFHSLV